MFENHKFDCLTLFNRIAASTDGCIILLFFFSCFTFIFDCVYISFFIYLYFNECVVHKRESRIPGERNTPLCC